MCLIMLSMSVKIALIMVGAKTVSPRLGKEQKRSRMSTYDVDYTDGRDFPVAVFEFKYRSKSRLSLLRFYRS